MTSQITSGSQRQDAARRGAARPGSARFGMVGQGVVWHGRADGRKAGFDSPPARALGWAWHGKSGSGSTRLGAARLGMVSVVEVGHGFTPWLSPATRALARLGEAGPGGARRGWDRRGLEGDWQPSGFEALAPAPRGLARRGLARRGAVRQGMAGPGDAWRGMLDDRLTPRFDPSASTSLGTAAPGLARQARAWLGAAPLCMAGRGAGDGGWSRVQLAAFRCPWVAHGWDRPGLALRGEAGSGMARCGWVWLGSSWAIGPSPEFDSPALTNRGWAFPGQVWCGMAWFGRARHGSALLVRSFSCS